MDELRLLVTRPTGKKSASPPYHPPEQTHLAAVDQRPTFLAPLFRVGRWRGSVAAAAAAAAAGALGEGEVRSTTAAPVGARDRRAETAALELDGPAAVAGVDAPAVLDVAAAVLDASAAALSASLVARPDTIPPTVVLMSAVARSMATWAGFRHMSRFRTLLGAGGDA